MASAILASVLETAGESVYCRPTALCLITVADPNDWVNVDYVLKQSNGKSNSATAGAQNAIVSKAASTAKDGPWSTSFTLTSSSPLL